MPPPARLWYPFWSHEHDPSDPSPLVTALSDMSLLNTGHPLNTGEISSCGMVLMIESPIPFSHHVYDKLTHYPLAALATDVVCETMTRTCSQRPSPPETRQRPPLPAVSTSPTRFYHVDALLIFASLCVCCGAPRGSYVHRASTDDIPLIISFPCNASFDCGAMCWSYVDVDTQTVFHPDIDATAFASIAAVNHYVSVSHATQTSILTHHIIPSHTIFLLQTRERSKR